MQFAWVAPLMGWLKTRWEGKHDGHAIVVSRNEIVRGFEITWDGETVARRGFSLLGLGVLNGTVDVEGKQVVVEVALTAEGLGDGACEVTVDGRAVLMDHVY